MPLEQVWMNQLKPGQDVDDTFVVRKLEIKEYNGRKFLSLEFGDKTGRMPAVCWDGTDDYLRKVAIGNIVRVRGSVGTYKDMPQINVTGMEVLKEGQFDPTDYLPVGPREPHAMLEAIDKLIDTVQDEDYRTLLKEIFTDGIIRVKFSHVPAAKLWHHSYVGGLAEHTLNVASMCEAACQVYNMLNRDLLMTAALLHDVGKTETYSLANFFEYSDEGRLIGHIVIADRMICNKISRLPTFPAEKKKLIRHMVLSHQGTLEQASPVVPQTLEAVVLYVVDLLDSQVGGILKVSGKPRQVGRRWSEYVRLLDRFLYFGEDLPPGSYGGEE